MPKCPKCGESKIDNLEKTKVTKTNEEGELEGKIGYDCLTCGHVDWREEFEVDDWVEITLRFKRTAHGSQQSRIKTDSSDEVSEELLRSIYNDWGHELGAEDIDGELVER